VAVALHSLTVSQSVSQSFRVPTKQNRNTVADWEQLTDSVSGSE